MLNLIKLKTQGPLGRFKLLLGPSAPLKRPDGPLKQLNYEGRLADFVLASEARLRAEFEWALLIDVTRVLQAFLFPLDLASVEAPSVNA